MASVSKDQLCVVCRWVQSTKFGQFDHNKYYLIVQLVSHTNPPTPYFYDGGGITDGYHWSINFIYMHHWFITSMSIINHKIHQ